MVSDLRTSTHSSGPRRISWVVPVSVWGKQLLLSLDGPEWLKSLDRQRIPVVVAVLMDPAIPGSDLIQLESYVRQGTHKSGVR